MPELSYNVLRTKLMNAVSTKEPFSMVRVGDGEGIVIGYPEFVGEVDFDKRIAKWTKLGRKMTLKDRRDFARQMREAICAANIVGVPADHHMSIDNNWRNARRFLKYFSLVKQDHCLMDFTIRLQVMDEWRAIIGRAKRVFCISCRNIGKLLKKEFGLEDVQTFLLAPQVRPCMGPILQSKPHWPTRYAEVPKWLRSIPAKGNLFLVGAGGFGKVYCHMIKQHGGIAFDVGSLFDGWAGYGTRSYIRDNPKRFVLR